MQCLQTALLWLLVFSFTAKVYGQTELDPQVAERANKRNRFVARKTPSYTEQTHSFFIGMNWNTTIEQQTPILYDLDPFHSHPMVPYPIGYFFINEPAQFELFPTPELGYTYHLRNETSGMTLSILLTQNRFHANTKLVYSDIHSELHFRGQEWRLLLRTGSVKYIGPWQFNFNTLIGFGMGKQYSLESRFWYADGSYFQTSDGLNGKFYQSDFTLGLSGGIAYSISDSWSVGFDYNLYKVKSGSSVATATNIAERLKQLFIKQGYWNNGFSLQLTYCFKRKSIK